MSQQAVDQIRRGVDDIESQQERFSEGSRWYGSTNAFSALMEYMPAINARGRERNTWLANYWHKIPIWAGMIRNEAALNASRKFSIEGGRVSANRARRVMMSSWVAPGLWGYRQYMMAQSVSFHTQGGTGAVEETARQRISGGLGPLAGFFFVDPARCVLTGDMGSPISYNNQPWSMNTHWRLASSILTSESTYGYALSSTELAVEVLNTLYLAHVFDRGELDPASVGGLVFLKMTDTQLRDALVSRDDGGDSDPEALKFKEAVNRVFGRLGVIADPHEMPEMRKMILRSVPKGLEDREKFLNLCVYMLANIIGRDAAEYWPVNGGSFGNGQQTSMQAQKAAGKAGGEFLRLRQDKLNDEVYGLPSSVSLAYDIPDIQARLTEAEIANHWIDFGRNAASPLGLSGDALFDIDSVRSMLVEKVDAVDASYTPNVEEAVATDTTDATETGNGTSDTRLEERQLKLMQERIWERPRMENYMRRLMDEGRSEEIIRTVWQGDGRWKTRTLFRIEEGAAFHPRTGEKLYQSVWVNRSVARSAERVSRMLYEGESDDGIVVEITVDDVDAAIAAADERGQGTWHELMGNAPLSDEEIDTLEGGEE